MPAMLLLTDLPLHGMAVPTPQSTQSDSTVTSTTTSARTVVEVRREKNTTQR